MQDVLSGEFSVYSLSKMRRPDDKRLYISACTILYKPI